MEPPLARDHQTSTKKHKLGIWDHIQEMREISLELTKDWDEDVEVIFEMVLVLLFSFFSSSISPPFLSFLLLSLVLGFILALECRER